MLDRLAMAAFAVDHLGRITYVNEAAVAMLGSGPATAIGGGDDVRSGIFSEQMRGAVDEVVRLVRSSGSWVGELAMVRADGTSAPMATSWTAVAAEGPAPGALVLVEDTAGMLPLQVLGDGENASPSVPRPQARRLLRLAEVTSELLVAESREAVAKVVTEHLTDAAEAAIGSLSLVLDEDTLELVGIRGVREGVAAQWATYSLAGNNPAAEACRTR